MGPEPMTGWVCPIPGCGKVNSPWVASCNHIQPDLKEKAKELVSKEGFNLSKILGLATQLLPLVKQWKIALPILMMLLGGFWGWNKWFKPGPPLTPNFSEIIKAHQDTTAQWKATADSLGKLLASAPKPDTGPPEVFIKHVPVPTTPEWAQSAADSLGWYREALPQALSRITLLETQASAYQRVIESQEREIPLFKKELDAYAHALSSQRRSNFWLKVVLVGVGTFLVYEVVKDKPSSSPRQDYSELRAGFALRR